MRLSRRALMLAPLGASALLARPALAQATWPERPLRLIVPFPAGSTPDTAGRAVATHLGQVLGQPCVVENKAGAGGNIGTEAVAKATDGHTIGVSINGPLSTAPSLYPNLGYDPAKDLAPISLLLRGAQILVVHPDVPGRDFAGFVAHAKANPGKLAFGSVGSGSGSHLAMADIMARTGIEMLHVPYRGFPPAVVDLIAGRIQALVLIGAGILPQLQAGQVRALAVTAEARLPQAPEVPTLAEVGLPDAASYAWNGLIGPASMPAERVERLSEETRKALAVPATRAALEGQGFEVLGSTPAEFARTMAAERARWGGLIARLGIKAEA
ncbi:tripartite tricarboxylate transporter substrate binding protein [Siccirubricoccus sp. KC 17139]|uniref:Tripartite tricarboxylate transporter substrate binding protein n=1 Tax=Siccirubricoccus soli TaxID=2899147 RepID=A0ABT1D904_9PROT|nr:tripartite tricarboxylate transporter substrate binding protein [Siccirubricoccus soli]MCO6418339.1 tripartite tricarboxylate transporter substrate binding protein [Siccirubricoccus soli]MCP2684474.1 tripartite tricarboxylate transporter substrate binding protein [Siccirubricoccus soli]